MATIDDIINGTFSTLGREVPFVPSPSTSEMYAGIIPRGNGMWGSNRPAITPRTAYSPYMTANERAQLEQQIAQSKAMQATMGNTPKTMMASGPAWTDPTELDLAAIDKWNSGMAGDSGSMLAMFPDKTVNPAVAAATSAGNPVTNVTGKMQPTNRGGGLAELLFGPSKNGMSGLAGLLGGPGAGGLMGQMTSSSGAREPYKVPRKDPVYGVSATGQRTDYGASPGQRTAGLKPGDRVYNADSNSWELK